MADNENGPQLVEPDEQAEQEQSQQEQSHEVPQAIQVATPRCMGCGAQPFTPVLLDAKGYMNLGVPLPEGSVLKAVSCMICGGVVSSLWQDHRRRRRRSRPLVAFRD